jgi:hypothetical protein
MSKLRNFTEFIDEKKSPFKKATLLKYKRKFENGEDIPFAIENSLKAQGMIPRADGEIRVSDEYKDSIDKLKDSIKPKSKETSPEKKKIIKESFEEDMHNAEVTLTLKDKEGHDVEVREIEGTGMAGEPMTFAYVFHDGNLSSRDKVRSRLKPSDFKELTDYLADITDNNEASAISFVK